MIYQSQKIQQLVGKNSKLLMVEHIISMYLHKKILGKNLKCLSKEMVCIYFYFILQLLLNIAKSGALARPTPTPPAFNSTPIAVHQQFAAPTQVSTNNVVGGTGDGNRPVTSSPVAGTPWCIVWTGDGRIFFYNPTTKTSVWQRPPELYNRPDVDILVSKRPDGKLIY